MKTYERETPVHTKNNRQEWQDKGQVAEGRKQTKGKKKRIGKVKEKRMKT